LTRNIEQITSTSPVIPVLAIESLEDVLPLAEALCEGGLSVLEVTLRTPIALQAIALIRKNLPDAIVGAGTVLNAEDLRCALEAGSEFIVSPGTTPQLVDAVLATQTSFLPGVSTASEAMNLLEKGFSHLKFFPAQAAGGQAMLKALYGPLPQIRFCPTGGIDKEKAHQYLALPNVMCVGGSWMAPKELVREKNWPEIKRRAEAAANMSAV